MAQSSLKHVVFITGPGFTHVRPCIYTCMRLTKKFPNVFISIYTAAPLADQGKEYLMAHSGAGRERLRIIPSVVDIPIMGPFDLILSMDRSFGPWIASQLTSPSMEINGFLVEAPSYIIEDHINGGIALANKEYHSLPIASWWVTTAAAFLGHLGNEKNGGGWRLFGAIGTALDAQEAGKEKSFDTTLSEAMTDRVVHVPGLLPHYEHEQVPQPITELLPLLVKMYKRWMVMSEQTNMVVFSSLYEMEPIAAEACKSALTLPVTSFFVGLAADLPPAIKNLEPTTSDPALSFMSRAYTELGPHSVVYIGFGSIWFPSPQSGRHLRTLIEEILAQGLRLIFSVKADSARKVGLDEEYIGKLTAGGQAIFPEWVKQLDVLEHPAIHYFVSHGGWNSTSEAILRGVPIIFWPIAGDQATNAMQIAKQLDCGFELLQVRAGPARSISYSPNGDISITGSDEAMKKEVQTVLNLTKGERGAHQRLNMQSLGRVAQKSVMDGGSGDLALEKFGNAIGL